MADDGVMSGKVAVVTDAGRGIGRAIAIGYATAGAAVCCIARTESDITRTVVDIRRDGGTPASEKTHEETARLGLSQFVSLTSRSADLSPWAAFRRQLP